MSSNERGALCVSIHDVSPASWAECLILWRAVSAVADIPMTWLVVPRYHGRPHVPVWFDAALDRVLSRDHELALHGYTHLDDGPPPLGMRAAFLRRVWTHGEGEFAALCQQEARRRLVLGQAWFARRGWPLHGFVAPAWLLGEGAWSALRDAPFDYTSTLTHFHRLAPVRSEFAPTLFYTARNGCGRWASRLASSAQACLQSRSPLVRLSLHPRDAHHPALLHHLCQLLPTLLAGRQPLTKAEYARSGAGRVQGHQTI